MKIVTVGTSKIVEKMIEQMKMVDIEVFACVSRDLSKAKEFAKKNNIEQFSNNYDGVLKSDAFDFVYIAVPNSLHYEYAKKALMANKNVIIEKPFALNQRQTSELISLAVTKHLFIFENMRIYHSLAFRTLKQDIERLKPIKMVKMSYNKVSTVYSEFKNNIPQSKLSLQYGSGALTDLNCYNVAFCVALFGLPITASYFCNKEQNIDVSGTAVLKYHGFICDLSAAKDVNGKNFISIEGEEGRIEFNGEPGNLDNYTIYLKDGTSKSINYMETRHFLTSLKDYKRIYENKDTDRYDGLMKLSLMEMKVLDELRKSAGIKFENE